MLVKKEHRICDHCKKDVGKPYIKVEDVTNEGCSVISFGRKSFEFTDGDYCSLRCFFDEIADELGEVDNA